MRLKRLSEKGFLHFGCCAQRLTNNTDFDTESPQESPQFSASTFRTAIPRSARGRAHYSLRAWRHGSEYAPRSVGHRPRPYAGAPDCRSIHAARHEPHPSPGLLALFDVTKVGEHLRSLDGGRTCPGRLLWSVREGQSQRAWALMIRGCYAQPRLSPRSARPPRL